VDFLEDSIEEYLSSDKIKDKLPIA